MGQICLSENAWNAQSHPILMAEFINNPFECYQFCVFPDLATGHGCAILSPKLGTLRIWKESAFFNMSLAKQPTPFELVLVAYPKVGV